MKMLSAHRAAIDGIIEFHEGNGTNSALTSVHAWYS